MKSKFLLSLCLCGMLLTSCSYSTEPVQPVNKGVQSAEEELGKADTSIPAVQVPDNPEASGIHIPEYSGKDVITLNNNVTSFTEDELASTKSFEKYSDLDNLGRCGVAFANIGRELIPTEKRGSIGSVKPTGWVQKKYTTSSTGSDNPFLYNRAHLIAFSLAGENANEKNLITGTRQMNLNMCPYEDKVREYIYKTNHHVLYRVTPVFEGNNLLCTGVQMEARSLEDNTINFNIFVYNVENNVSIDYTTGNSTGEVYE